MATREQLPADRTAPVRSNVHIAGHPVHPILIPFPIAFLTAAAASDVAYVISSDPFWARASLWLLAAGFISGVVAALTGLIDFITIERVRSHSAGWIHLVGNAIVLGIALANWLPRIGAQESFVAPWGLALSLVTGALLVITGWTGGELAYRHKIGVVDNR